MLAFCLLTSSHPSIALFILSIHTSVINAAHIRANLTLLLGGKRLMGYWYASSHFPNSSYNWTIHLRWCLVFRLFRC